LSMAYKVVVIADAEENLNHYMRFFIEEVRLNSC
jgi:hypothetical protein